MPIYQTADCLIDTHAREFLRAGVPVPVAPKVFDLLTHLLAHRGRVVTKQELLETVWQGAAVSDAVIHRAVVKLREALNEAPGAVPALRTLHRVGYRWVADVEERRPAPAPPAGPLPEAGSAASAARQPAAVLRSHSGMTPAERPRVALQNFVNATGDAAHDWAAWGLPRLVCEALADHPELAPVNQSAVAEAWRSLPEGSAHPRTLGRLLGARWTVAGRLEPGDGTADGLSLRYTVDGGPAGEHRVDAPDVARLAQALAQAIGHWAESQSGWTAQADAQDPFAEQALQRARQHMARTEWAAAAHLLKVVLDLSPRNTAARLLWLTVLPQLNDEAVFPEGERLLDEARRQGDLRLQAVTHEILGRACFNHRRPGWADRGRAHLETALALAQAWAHEDWVLRIHLNLGYVLQLQCEHDAAARHYEAAQRRLAQSDNIHYRAATLNNRALIECFRERPQLAADLAHEGWQLCEQHGLAHTAITCRATLAVAEMEQGSLLRAERCCRENLAALREQATLDADSAAWALFVAAQCSFVLRREWAGDDADRAIRSRLTVASPHAEILSAAGNSLWQAASQPAEQTAQQLLDVMQRSESAGLREHTHHLARLALEAALRGRSGAMLWRIRHFLDSLGQRRPDTALDRALSRARAAEAVWRGELAEAAGQLEQACQGAPAGRFQALARLDLTWLHLLQGDAAAVPGQLAWLSSWLEALPAGLVAHAGWLASQGQATAAVDMQLAAVRLRPAGAPAAWFDHLGRFARGEPPVAGANTLLTLA